MNYELKKPVMPIAQQGEGLSGIHFHLAPPAFHAMQVVLIELGQAGIEPLGHGTVGGIVLYLIEHTVEEMEHTTAKLALVHNVRYFRSR